MNVRKTTLIERLAAVLSDDDIDAALAAFAAFGSGARDSDAEAALARGAGHHGREPRGGTHAGVPDARG